MPIADAGNLSELVARCTREGVGKNEKPGGN